MDLKWEQVKQKVQFTRCQLLLNYSTVDQFKFDMKNNKAYFLGSKLGSKMNLFSVDIPREGRDVNELTWSPLLKYNWQHDINSDSQVRSDSEEEIHVNRYPINSFQFLPNNNKLGFEYNSQFYYINTDLFTKPEILKGYSKRINWKMGGTQSDLVAFNKDNNLYVCELENGYNEIALTNDENDSILNGIPEYVMKEEFYRSSGFEWSPNTDDNVERILFTRVDQTNVDKVSIPKSDNYNLDQYHYPRAGTKNATSHIFIAEFSYCSATKEFGNINLLGLYNQFNILNLFPWAEYLVRFGWLPGGQSVWAQLLDRTQKHTVLIKIPIGCFQKQDDNNDAVNPTIEILYEEYNNVWINVSDVYYFFKQSEEDKTQLIWSSELDGYRHLYLIIKPKNEKFQSTQITFGKWSVVDQPIYVNEKSNLVYFFGKKDTVLETQFYFVNFKNNAFITRVTKPGFNHNVFFDLETNCIIDVSSSLNQSTQAYFYSILNTETSFCILKSSINKNDYLNLPKEELFQVKLKDGTILKGIMIKPPFMEENKKYPLLVNVYGGPKIQIVANEFKYTKFITSYLLAKMGFIIIMVDNRGSANRGLSFESSILNKLGESEIEDQKEAVNALLDSGKYQFIDGNRIGIMGWSYGGYLSLMGLIKYPELFQMAIAGAPVTNWTLYNTAYTERYLNLISNNEVGYQQSNITNYIDRFPDKENRLFLTHGLVDDNVHFLHSQKLTNLLIQGNKPYYLQIYPNEKHGLRNLASMQHFETQLCYWLLNYL